MWDVNEQQQRADFMEHMYRCSGRTNGLYTGLWQQFCLNEAGPYCRALHFERQKAIADFIAQQQTLSMNAADCYTGTPDTTDACRESFVPTFHD